MALIASYFISLRTGRLTDPNKDKYKCPILPVEIKYITGELLSI
jgi:hypothetical protein